MKFTILLPIHGNNKIMTQGWHESRNKVMCFYQHQVIVPNMLNQLSDYVDLITKEKTITLNPMTMPYVRKGDNRNVDVESKKALINTLLTSKCKVDKWTMPKKRNTTKIKNIAIDKERKTKKDRNVESDQENHW